jgi:hypothetical protein
VALSHGYIDANSGRTVDVDSPICGAAGERIAVPSAKLVSWP